MSWFHPEEEYEVGEVLGYHYEHPDACYRVTFADEESYICVFDSAFESENGCELDIEMEDPRYDEFYMVVLKIVETVHDGARRYNEWLSLDYRDFPVSIRDADTGAIICPVQSEPRSV